MIFVASFGDGEWGLEGMEGREGCKRTPYGAIFAASAFQHGTINVYPLCSVPSLPNTLAIIVSAADKFGEFSVSKWITQGKLA